MEIFMSHLALNSSEHLLASIATLRDLLIDSLQPSSLELNTLHCIALSRKTQIINKLLQKIT